MKPETTHTIVTTNLKKKINTAKTRTISLRVSEADYRYIRKEAQKQKQSISEYIISKVYARPDFTPLCQQYQELNRNLYRANESLKKQCTITPDVQQAIHQTVQWFVQ